MIQVRGFTSGNSLPWGYWGSGLLSDRGDVGTGREDSMSHQYEIGFPDTQAFDPAGSASPCAHGSEQGHLRPTALPGSVALQAGSPFTHRDSLAVLCCAQLHSLLPLLLQLPHPLLQLQGRQSCPWLPSQANFFREGRKQEEKVLQ